MVKMKRNRNSDAHGIVEITNQINDHLISAHVLSGAFRCLDHNRSLRFFSSSQNALCPFQVVGVERTDCIVALMSLLNHFCCRNHYHNAIILLMCY